MKPVYIAPPLGLPSWQAHIPIPNSERPPYEEGYRILPRRPEDIQRLDPILTVASSTVTSTAVPAPIRPLALPRAGDDSIDHLLPLALVAITSGLLLKLLSEVKQG